MASTPPAPAVAPSLVDTLFQRSLNDLVKFLRADPSSTGEAAAVARALSEIHREIRAPDAATKSVALQKLTYLSSLHFAPIASHPLAFLAIELLASPHLPHKRLAYLAASLSLHPVSLSLLPLATHQLHKDLSPSAGVHHHVSALALQLLASPAAAAAPDLPVHLAQDLVPHLARGCPRAIAAAARVIAASPSAAVPVLFKPLAACLASPDPRASTAAVAAFCDLSAPPADATPFLPLAPDLYNLLTTSRSNWALIKVLKLFARLAPLESRLAARIVDPVCQLLTRSAAMSLTFECIRTVLTALPAHDAAVRLAIGKAMEFIAAADDSNLRYLGLLALGMLGPAYASTVNDCREAIAKSLGDADTNIRQEALRLIMGMVNENNIMDIAALLISHVAKSDPEFANDILGAVLAACGHNVYEMVVDFDWYVSLLAHMARTLHCAQGDEIGRQLVDVGLRVQDARPELVRSARTLLIDPALLGNHFLFPVLSAAAWISGEYVDLTKDPVELVEALLQPRTSLLPISVRAVYIHAVFKVITWCFSAYIGRLGDSDLAMDVMFDRLAADETVNLESNAALGSGDEQDIGASTVQKDPFSHESILYMINLIQTTVGPLINCNEVEVQERAHNLIGFVHLVREIQGLNKRKVADGDKSSRLKELVKTMRAVFCQELGPVYVNAQMKVSPPDGLILNENLVELAGMVSEDDTTPSTSIFFYPRSRHSVDTRDEPAVSIGLSSLSEHRKRHGLFYLQTGKAEDEPNDYPQANDSLPSSSNNSANDDKWKTAERVFAGKKSTATKTRPKVVKLDTEDFLSSMMPSAIVPKEDPLSGALRDVLLGSDAKALSSQKASDMNLEVMLNKANSNESSSQQIENLGSHPASHSRTSKQQNHDKEKVTDRPESDGKEPRKHRSSGRSGHRQGKNKHREKSSAQPDIVPQTPVIQDFLL
ncbi:AP-3 complex subunit delta [Zea mays]|uniref:Clathrin/coatomer adaptor adaptin-like N-terminal domain-containing protein n=1 Tax=Zea mays TaxID=4577 RepID=A0A804RDR2_MAIZE|nr:AP-3 complex subunit delta [Zea mays]|eukprot:XP_008662607.1 AP-3 complex subunit delta [Zea mays]